MFLTGFNTQQDRENRTRDYYNNLRRRIKLNTEYEESINSNVDRTISGITKPPPPEENLERDLNDLNLQKQKAFESIKEILKKHDESTKFLTKLEDSEIVPFNRYFAKFKNTTTGIDVKDADFLIKLWDTFKKKILLTDKETPILGTELETYKKELQSKADDIVNYADELGMDVNRIKMVLDKMVNDSDSAAIDKFYYNLLTKGIPAARLVLKEDFEGTPTTPSAILTEEVLPEAARTDYETRLENLEAEKRRYFDPLRALIVRDIPYEQEISFGVKPVDRRILDIRKISDQNIIKRHLPSYVRKIKKINKDMNKYLGLLGSENRVPLDDVLREFELDEATRRLIPDLSLTVPVEEEPERPAEVETEEVVPLESEKALKPVEGFKFDFDSLSDDNINDLIEVMNADSKKIYNEIIRIHPDGKFEYNGVKYNLNRNPPLLEKQIEYVLKPFYDFYGVRIPPKALFKQLKESERYKNFQTGKQIELEEKEAKQEFISEIKKGVEEREKKLLNKAEKKKFLDDLQKEQKLIANELYTKQKLFENKTIKPVIEGIKERLYRVANISGFKDINFRDEDIEGAFQNNINDTVINLMRLITATVESDLDRIEKVEKEYKSYVEKKDTLIEQLGYATGKEAKRIKNKLSQLEAEIKTADEFLSKNKKFYNNTIEAIDKLQVNLFPLSEFIQEVKTTQSDNFQRERENFIVEIQPLEDRYNQIQVKLINEGIDTPDLEEMMASIESLNKGSTPKVKKSKNIINVPKFKPEPFPTKSKQSQKNDKVKSKAERRSRDEADEEERLRRYGGSGMKKKRDRLTKLQFGKYTISGKALGSGILDIRTECNRTSAKIGKTPISSKLEKAINYVIKNNDIDIDMFEDLNLEEKNLFLYALEIAEVELNSIPFNIFKKFNANDINKELDSIIDRYHILVGELGAGNNAPEILREVRGIIFKLLGKKKIDKKYANELLLMINSVA